MKSKNEKVQNFLDELMMVDGETHSSLIAI